MKIFIYILFIVLVWVYRNCNNRLYVKLKMVNVIFDIYYENVEF